MVEGEVVNIWIQRGILKYSLKLSQVWGQVHECNVITYNIEVGLNSYYGTRVKAATCYWVQVKLMECPIICCYTRGKEHYVGYSLFIEAS